MITFITINSNLYKSVSRMQEKMTWGKEKELISGDETSRPLKFVKRPSMPIFALIYQHLSKTVKD